MLTSGLIRADFLSQNATLSAEWALVLQPWPSAPLLSTQLSRRLLDRQHRPDDGLGKEETPQLQEGVRRKVPKGPLDDDPRYLLSKGNPQLSMTSFRPLRTLTVQAGSRVYVGRTAVMLQCVRSRDGLGADSGLPHLDGSAMRPRRGVLSPASLDSSQVCQSCTLPYDLCALESSNVS